MRKCNLFNLNSYNIYKKERVRDRKVRQRVDSNLPYILLIQNQSK